MKTRLQKKARELLDSMNYFRVSRLRPYRSDYRVKINGEAYVMVTSLSAFSTTDKLKRYARKNGWQALDLFPAKVSAPNFGVNTYLVRTQKLEKEGDVLIDYLFSNSADKNRDVSFYKETLRLSHSKWPDADGFYYREYTYTEEQAQRQENLWRQRQELLRMNEDDMEPDIETCIKVLKKHGYKIQKPVTTYEEV